MSLLFVYVVSLELSFVCWWIVEVRFSNIIFYDNFRWVSDSNLSLDLVWHVLVSILVTIELHFGNWFRDGNFGTGFAMAIYWLLFKYSSKMVIEFYFSNARPEDINILLLHSWFSG